MKMSSTRDKNLLILIGAKGSGKTYIGSLLENKLGIPFIRVEPIFLNLKKSRDIFDSEYITEGFIAVEREIKACLKKTDSAVIESTGLAPQFNDMTDRLKEHCTVTYVKIEAPPDLCLQRVHTRNRSAHIDVSDEDVTLINQKVSQLTYTYRAVIHNTPASENQIISVFKDIL